MAAPVLTSQARGTAATRRLAASSVDSRRKCDPLTRCTFRGEKAPRDEADVICSDGDR
jgi:hypothetical protein